MAGDNDRIDTGDGGNPGGDTPGIAAHGTAQRGADAGGGRAVAVTGESSALIAMIERAARDPNVDIDKMERLFQMQQKAVDRHAKTAFLAAFAQLQSELPAAARKGIGHNAKKYARFEDVMEAIRPHLAEHGFSISHRVNTDGNMIRVTGILGHCDGHSEQTEMTLPPDASGGKTPVHAMGSSISYGKRYVTLTLTGIATEDDDDGKKASASATISDEQSEELAKLISSVGADLDWILAHHKVESLSDMTARDYSMAKAGLLTRQRELAKAAANG